MKHGLLFGLNYPGQEGELKGCARDAQKVADYLIERGYDRTKVYTSDADTSAVNIVNKIYGKAVDSWRLNLREVCIMFSGHGSSIERNWRSFNRNWSDNESDGCDECLVPTDHMSVGVIPDNLIKRLLRYFNPATRVVLIIDACHSGSMCDLKYELEGGVSREVKSDARCASNIICISGCKDEQYSYVGYNLEGKHEHSSVLTTCLLRTLREGKTSIKEVHERVKQHVAETHYPQVPQVSSSFVVEDCEVFLLE